MEYSSIKNEFKKTGIKFSQKKAELFSKILDSEKSFDALTLYEEIKDDLSIDRATVYRSLNQFREKELIRETINIDGKQFYENKTSKIHPHFICNSCKTIECLKETVFDLDIQLEKKVIDSVSINITGLCKDCQ